MIYVAQVFGFLGITLWILSIQQKSGEKILLTQLISNLLYALQYFLLAAYSGFITYVLATFRCFIFYKKNK